MRTVTVTLGELIDRALLELESPAEAALTVLFSDAATAVGSTVTVTLPSGDVNVSDVIEWDAELLLVTAVSGTSVTMTRGYYGTTVAAHLASTPAKVNPQYARYRIAEAVRRAPTRLEALGVPLISSTSFARSDSTSRSFELPDNCRQVLRLYALDRDGLPFEIGGWREMSSIPSTGNLLLYPPVGDVSTMHVVFSAPYEWSTSPAFPDEAATLTVPAGAEELPALYAAAWMIGSREVSRQEIDRSNEHNTQDQVRVQSGVGLMRAKWQEFYRALDEARRVVDHDVPKHRPVVRRPRAYPLRPSGTGVSLW